VRNFRFDPQIFRGVILLIESKLTPPNVWCAQDAAGIAVADQCTHLLALPCALDTWHGKALAGMLCHVPSISSCSHFSLILQPHRVTVPFLPTFASPWRNSFVQLHGGTTLLKAKIGTTPQKRPKNDLNWGVGSSYGTNKPPLPNPSSPYEDTSASAGFPE